MSEATHAFCPQCNKPCVMNWNTTFKNVSVQDGLKTKTFEGRIMKCLMCGLEIAKIGTIYDGEISP